MHGLDRPVGVLLHLFVAEADAPHQVAVEIRDHGIFPDVPDTENTGGPAFLRQKGEAVFDGFLGRTVLDRLSMELDHAAALSHGAEEILQHLSTARAVQTGDPQDLSLPELERGVPEAGIFAGEMFHLQDGLTRLVGLGRETVGELTAYHQLDDLIHGKLLGGPCGHPGPITHDRNIVGDTEDLLHLMADVDDAAALVPQHIDDAEEMLHLGLRQGGGRLVLEW